MTFLYQKTAASMWLVYTYMLTYKPPKYVAMVLIKSTVSTLTHIPALTSICLESA